MCVVRQYSKGKYTNARNAISIYSCFAHVWWLAPLERIKRIRARLWMSSENRQNTKCVHRERIADPLKKFGLAVDLLAVESG